MTHPLGYYFTTARNEFLYWFELRERFAERLGLRAVGPFGTAAAPFVIRRWGSGRPRTVEAIEADPWITKLLAASEVRELKLADTEGREEEEL